VDAVTEAAMPFQVAGEADVVGPAAVVGGVATGGEDRVTLRDRAAL
jgi:hypothetical protein